jgi:hypothetical protein
MAKGAAARLVELNQEMANADKSQIKFTFNNKSLRDSLEKTLKTINDTSDAVKGHPDIVGGAVDDKNTVWSKMTEGWKQYAATVDTGQTFITTNTLKGLQTVENGIVNMLMGVKTSFKDMARTILADLIRMQVRALIVRSLTGGFGFTIPGLAHGGAVKKNQPYLVGEQGAELFVSNTNGKIIPNSQLNTATGEVKQVNAEINFNVQAIDAASFNNYLVNNRSTIEGIINSSLTSNGSVRRTIKQVV